MALDILEGLVQLHAMHILHLDLKPGNVLLDDHGHAYLSDFGISHALRTLEQCSAVTGKSGTPHYMCVNFSPFTCRMFAGVACHCTCTSMQPVKINLVDGLYITCIFVLGLL